MLQIGCHLTITKGFENLALQASKIGATTFQYFTRNPRGGKVRALDQKDMERFFVAEKEIGLLPFVAHAPYTLNPASDKDYVLEFAKLCIREDLERLEYLPGNYYNFHPGSHVGQGEEKGIEKIIQILNEIITPEQNTVLLLETMAGKGTEIGWRFEHLAKIRKGLHYPQKVGVLLDTCHVYDAGYNIKEDLEGVLEEFDQVIGIEHLKALHLNDSKNPMGSRKDRHEVLGGGYLGEEIFTQIVNHPFLRKLPMVLETPQELEGYEREIKWLREQSLHRS